MMLVQSAVGAVQGAGGSASADGGGEPRARPVGAPSARKMMDGAELPSNSWGVPAVAAAPAPAPLFNTDPVPFLRNHARDDNGN